MSVLALNDVSKSFGPTKAVSGVTFSAEEGQITAVIGPNGAGKTTTIRMILDLLQPDSGEILIFGNRLTSRAKNKVGYLPEERGLYRNATLEECVMLFGRLKGLSRRKAKQQSLLWYERFGLLSHRRKMISQLSRGMQQKAQFIVALIHQPKLLIVDEPFAALDPVSTRLIKRTLKDAAAEGACIILCTHQMHLVDEIADFLVMINRGSVALSGKPAAIRRQFSSGTVLVKGNGALARETSVYAAEGELERGHYRLRLAERAPLSALLSEISAQKGFELEHLEVEHPSLEEIFVRVAGDDPGAHQIVRA